MENRRKPPKGSTLHFVVPRPVTVETLCHQRIDALAEGHLWTSDTEYAKKYVNCVECLAERYRRIGEKWKHG